ncbi:MAG: arginase [Acidobacteria bacterium]|nr:arginase [Acidobacteriota bacterium]
MPARRISVVGVPLDMGSGRRGVDMGPSALRVARLNARIAELGYQLEDLGNLAVRQPESLPPGEDRARYLEPIAEVCAALAALVEHAAKEGRLPLVLGGDHSIAAGSVAGVAAALRTRGERLGVVWIDAHTDMNTPETSPSGNVHGMPLASLIGHGPVELTHLRGFAPVVRARNVALVGVRDVDALERGVVKDSGVHVFTMRDIDERGMRAVMADALRVAGDGTAGVHVSLDMDALDPAEAPGVGTPVRGGVTYREAHLAMETIADAGSLVSMDVVEVNPVLDEANRTALLAVELVASALGKRIL